MMVLRQDAAGETPTGPTGEDACATTEGACVTTESGAR